MLGCRSRSGGVAACRSILDVGIEGVEVDIEQKCNYERR
jgi:hypothetical protein